MKYKIFPIIFLLGGILGAANFSWAQTVADHVVISEVQLAGKTVKDEFVEIYNPTEQAVNLKDWKLKKKTSGGKEYNLLSAFPEINIASHGHLLITHKTDYQGTVTADTTFSGSSSSYSIADDNTVLLYDNNGQLIDKVGLGASSDFENNATFNPEAGQSVERKPGGGQGNGQDTDNNSADFSIQAAPNPQNSQSPAAPLIIADSNNTNNEAIGNNTNETTDSDNSFTSESNTTVNSGDANNTDNFGYSNIQNNAGETANATNANENSASPASTGSKPTAKVLTVVNNSAAKTNDVKEVAAEDNNDDEEEILSADDSGIKNNGEKIRIKGTVAVEPKILGKQIFYLTDPGIQVYLYSQDFPLLKIGDYVEVSGVLSENQGEKRIKLSSKEDVKILESRKPPSPRKIKISEANEDLEGYLVEVGGEVTGKEGNNVYLDDGSDEIKIYIKSSTGIQKSEFQKGDTVRMAGILSQTASGYRLLPRYPADISVEKKSEVTAKEKSSEFQMAATGQTSPEVINIPANNQLKEIKEYLIASAAALAIILIGLMFKMGVFPRIFKIKKSAEDKNDESSFTVTVEKEEEK